ncbi:hypothetical protein NA56DRAFT_644186 [Hyaloscypha hepaticicola]|uniref:Heterokaryon incompatibility domain-containing protein n=1 Tax=Hyaloscypha hepaticicola TaxID=2082293 RepID=A0A2J6QAL7_9HELO|nr:hypothetical protein NA56DRAFT_644186 [Hyaloscypha hepaticicola]
MYTYRPLLKAGEFRLLHLLPGQFGENIQCTLAHKSLTELPHYFAVSYTWGAPELAREVEVDGITIPVRENLFQLLQHLRQPHSSLVLWIDALCIDQSSILEKNIQVPLMGQIYSFAKSVFVWLGLHADGSEHFFESGPVDNQFQLKGGGGTPGLSTSISTKVATNAPISLYSRAYWVRTWIVQEIVLALRVDVFCGDRFCNWYFFISHTREKSEYDRTASDYAIRNIMAFRDMGQRMPLRRLLFRFHMTQCFDPRDLVYSLLNIAADTRDQDHGIIVDYSSSIETLFVQTLAFCSALSCVTVFGQAGGRAIECLRFCDTLATRLGAGLEPSIDFAQDALGTRSNSILTVRLSCKSYLVRLKRFARIGFPDPPRSGGGQRDSAANLTSSMPSRPENSEPQQILTRYDIRRIPGKESWSMWSLEGGLTLSDLVFAVDFDGSNEQSHELCCVCSATLYDTDSDGAKFYQYHIVGMGVSRRQRGVIDNSGTNQSTAEFDHCAFLAGRLRSLKGCEVIDGLPHYVLELTLQELVGMCQFGRATGAYQPWNLEAVSTVGHWKEDQGPFGINSF